MKNVANYRNGECLSNVYINNNSPLRWRCSEGHEWNATPGNIKSGKWCPICAKKNRADKFRDSIETMQEIAQSNGG